MAENEEGRLAALNDLQILDTEPEEAFEHIVSLVQSILGVPIAAVSLVDRDRQWFKARRGLAPTETPRNISFCSHAIEQAEPFHIPDARLDSRFADNPLVTGEPGIRSYTGIPLRTTDGFNVGALCAIDQKPRELTDAEVSILSNLAKIVEKELELRRIAERDALTGALTRRAFCEKAEAEIARFRRYQRPCSLVLADLDHFKQVNDTYGHQAGDRVLCEVTELVIASKRPTDSLGRLGGEEFSLIMPETDVLAAYTAVERFRTSLASHDIALPSGPTIRVTASFGIVQLSEAVTNVDDWLAAADVQLYAAKRAGRNRCGYSE